MRNLRLNPLDENLKKAIIFSLILNSVLASSNFYSRTYDSYAHMFFADHYRRSWFNTWEPKWYSGFRVTCYPPLTHQSIALLSFILSLETAYSLVTLILMLILPVAVYNFSKIFTTEKEAGYCALLSVFLPSVIQSIYVFGQLPLLYSLVATLLLCSSLHKYLTTGDRLLFIQSICLVGIAGASHHMTFSFFSLPLIFVVFLTLLIIAKTSERKLINKRFVLFISISGLLCVFMLYPFLSTVLSIGYQKPIPHPSRTNYFENLEVFQSFFINIYGPLLILIPTSFTVVLRDKKRLSLLFMYSILMFIFGLGGTTPVPQILLGGLWEQLVYGRFGVYASIALVVFSGKIVDGTLRNKKWGKIFTIFLLISMIGFASYVGNRTLYVQRPNQVPLQNIAAFLNRDYHWKWRYITLGFGISQMCKLSIMTNATTLDGFYPAGRTLPVLRESGIGPLDAAKYYPGGLSILENILVNSSEYNLKYILCNDPTYDELLNKAGFTPIDERYGSVTIWIKSDTPPVDIKTEPLTVSDFIWGILPLTILLVYLSTLSCCMLKRKC